jgi:hypothetical protein
MLIPNHPDDERLSALASGDPDARADSSLTDHVASCVRCTDTVAEIGALRASLGELPDLRPHRPLQLLPPVEDVPASRVDALGGWARRFFAPILTAGAALALVGLVGTTAPLLNGMAASGSGPFAIFQNVGESLDGGGADDGAEAGGEPATLNSGPEAAPSAGEFDAATEAQRLEDAADPDEEPARDSSAYEQQRDRFADERPIWPMVLFAGVAIMIAAGLLRWILAPRAG